MNTQTTKNIIDSIIEAFEKTEVWKNMTDYEKAVILDQVIVGRYIKIPAQMQLMVTLTDIESDKRFNHFKEETKLRIRGMIKTIARKLVQDKDDNMLFVVDNDIINSINSMLDAKFISENTVSNLLGKETFNKYKESFRL